MGLPLVINKTEQEVCSLVKEVCESASIAGKAKGVGVNCQTGTPSTVTMDRDRILQVISNLVDNAIRHTATGGYIEIGSQPGTESVKIWVLNSGEHIDSDQTRDLFQQYRQAGTRTGSLGLGLAIARSIVEEHGGRIWVEDHREGPAFCFTLPKKVQNAAA
jgi:signal transduction histidine kinase